MTAQELDVIVRVAGATLLLTAAVSTARGDRRLALYFLPLALCLCGFLAGNTPEPGLRLTGWAGHVGYLLTGAAAVFLWWFCQAVFDRSFRPRGAVLAAGIVWIVIAAADRGVFGPTPLEWGLSRLLVVMGLGMVAHLAWRLLRDRPGDLVAERRQARVIVVLLLGGQLLADLVIDAVMGFDWQPRAFSIVQNAAFLAFTGWLLHLNAGPTRAPTPGSNRRPEIPARIAASSGPEDDRLAERLRVLIEVQQVHLDPTLTFDRFTALMGATDRAVRRLINHRLGFDHFRTFLNAHRMVEARRRLQDPAYGRDKLITIAMDSGFASLASFNRVFQETEGCTPSAFRAAAAAGTAADPAPRPIADF